MKVITIPMGFIQENTYIYYNEDTLETLIIDPGGDGQLILNAIEENKFKVKYILLTHGHYDHMEAVPYLKKAMDINVVSHIDEVVVTDNASINLSSKVKGAKIEFKSDILLKDGDEITFSDMKIKIIHTPGHTPGGCCYYVEDDNVLFSGDTLFFESIGRTDFELGNEKHLIESIKHKLFILPDNIIVLCGHGESTTIGHEKTYNPFVI